MDIENKIAILAARLKQFLANKKTVLSMLGLAVVLIAGLALVRIFMPADNANTARTHPNDNKMSTAQAPLDSNKTTADSTAVAAGKQISGGKCDGEGPVKLTALPMKKDDFAMIIPYGLVVDGHVTPIDHQYFSPAVFNSPPDTYPVYALADGHITNISHRAESVGNVGKPSNDYRFVFSHTCTLLTYFDLVTSLAPDILAEFNKNKQQSGNSAHANLDISVKAGQLVGYIGGQTLDFAVWDTQKPLVGFVNPGSYSMESWKIYTADPLDYYSPEAKEVALSKYLRSDAGKSGKIDWDVDGKLVGNWFQGGTNGYAGDRNLPDGRYWRGHLSFAPDHLDSSVYIASFGTFKDAGDGEQFAIKSGGPLPSDVSVDSGLVKYDLMQYVYVQADGKFWNRTSYTLNPKISPSTKQGVAGCVLVQLLEPRKLKAQTFPGSACGKVSGFTDSAKVFVR